MIKNGAQVIHLATGMVVGYPPCPYLSHFCEFLEKQYHVRVVVGTHPIPQKYLMVHSQLKSWETQQWQEAIQPTLADEATRLTYD
jgi:hypothetical protein